MSKPLITSREVVEIAFPAASNMSPDSISELVVHIAEQKHIRPALGDALYAHIGDERFANFVQQYIKPALAYFVKCEVMSSLAVSMSNNGLAVMNPQYMSAATDKQRSMLYDSEFSKATTLLSEALEYITNNTSEFEPYIKNNSPKVTKHRRYGVLL